jgi:hypothetical protein
VKKERPTELEVRIVHSNPPDQPTVVTYVEGITLFESRANPALPGREYMAMFDLAHAAVLNWSPNLRAVLPHLRSIRGELGDRSTEALISAMTYSLVVNQDPFVIGRALDPDMVNAVVTSAARAMDAPTSAAEWERCLHASIDVFDHVARRGVRHLGVDLTGGLIRPLAGQ